MSYARVSVDTGQTLWLSAGDLRNAFYTIEIPSELRSFFTLDPILAGDVGLTTLEGKPISKDTLIYPRLRVVPMGWSHAVNACQTVVSSIILRVPELSEDDFVSDAKPLPSLDKFGVICYVDNMMTMSTNRNLSIEIQENQSTI